MEREEAIEELQAQNPWWKGEAIKLPENLIERDIFSNLWQELEKAKATVLIGLRRVGKTTISKHLIKRLLREKENHKICYFSFDLAKQIKPRELIRIYEEEILEMPFSQVKDRIYIFFDEIQKVENWGNQIKSVYEKDYNLKFFLTGSSSMNITKGAGESLLGRVRIRKLHPFSFREFLKYKGTSPPEISLEDINYPSRAKQYRIEFRKYFEEGGLPEIYKEDDLELLKQILDLVFFRDIVEIFPVKRSSVLKGIFRLITEKTGQKLNYTKLSSQLDTQYKTIKSYIQYLEDSFLIKRSRPYEGSQIKSLRKKPKIYVADHAYNRLWRTKKGLKAETIAFNHLKKLEEPYYNREPEVDFMLPEKKYALECKYRNEISKSDARNLVKAPGDFELFLITKKKYDTWEMDGRKVQLIPLWLLCLSLNK